MFWTINSLQLLRQFSLRYTACFWIRHQKNVFHNLCSAIHQCAQTWGILLKLVQRIWKTAGAQKGLTSQFHKCWRNWRMHSVEGDKARARCGTKFLTCMLCVSFDVVSKWSVLLDMRNVSMYYIFLIVMDGALREAGNSRVLESRKYVSWTPLKNLSLSCH